MSFARYAIYYTFPAGPLATFGSAWLGWNAATGEQPDAPIVHGLPAPAHDITATPRKYGLHGTIKPPFRLAKGTDFAELCTAFDDFCQTHDSAALDGLELAQLGRFLALVPLGKTAALTTLAGQAVAELDRFRAPPDPQDLARRRKAALTPTQEALLQQWGYPYVMEEMRFHITLTGRFSGDESEQIRQALAPHLEPLLPRPFQIDALTLCGEDDAGRFHELRRRPLLG